MGKLRRPQTPECPESGSQEPLESLSMFLSRASLVRAPSPSRMDNMSTHEDKSLILLFWFAT